MKKISVYKALVTFLLIQSLIACSSATYTKYTSPETKPMIKLTVDSQTSPSNFLKQESNGFFDTMNNLVNALNSVTFTGFNSGITSIDGAYINSPNTTHKYAIITPGKHNLGIATFLAGSSGSFYDNLEYDFRFDINYVVRIEPYGSNSIKTTLVDADTNTVLATSK